MEKTYDVLSTQQEGKRRWSLLCYHCNANGPVFWTELSDDEDARAISHGSQDCSDRGEDDADGQDLTTTRSLSVRLRHVLGIARQKKVRKEEQLSEHSGAACGALHGMRSGSVPGHGSLFHPEGWVRTRVYGSSPGVDRQDLIWGFVTELLYWGEQARGL